MLLPPLYPIIDAGVLKVRGVGLADFARELRDAGVTLLQYRDKNGSPQEVLTAAAILSSVFAATQARLIMNDRADLARLAGWSGVHVGHLDLSPHDAKHAVGSGVIGVSTHNEEQVIAADASEADYIAVGPVFGTSTKLDTEPVIGVEGVRQARALTRKPLVAIGGITLQNARSVIDAGADSVAVISAIFTTGQTPGQVVRDFFDHL